VLVYGDRAEIVAPVARLGEITARLRAAEESGPGPTRHDHVAWAFLEAAGLLQGVADAEFEARGCDDVSPVQDAALALVTALARKLAVSAWSGHAAIGPGVAAELMALAVLPLPDRLRVRTPEGFAFYAVYPEAYLKAAAEHPWPATPLVVGLRSIGAALAPLVAAASGARAVVTLRPTGPPFRRELKPSEQLLSLLAAHAGPFAIVDEGPGLSGSSFGAAADLLERLGVAGDRMVFFPSHEGDLGPEASLRHRARWASASRSVATFQDLLAETPLPDWFADLTGPVARAEDLSGGAWREAASAPDAPVHAAQERLKHRLHTASGRWLARFAGLGAVGEAKFERARALHQAGFTPEPLALRRGFLLERWEDGARGAALPRAHVVERLAAYLAFRAAAFPALAHEGASREALAEMARVNTAEALGEAAAASLAPRLERLAALAPVGRPVHVDGRLHAWEWLRTPDGLLLKTDALDHSAAHDLVGCQDITWDLAGAAVEFGLAPAEIARLCDAVAAATGERPQPAALAFHEVCYAAFQVGYWRMAEAAAPPQEQPRLAAQAARYRARLAMLAEGGGIGRLEGLRR
jgi:hypothetical protein